MKFLNLALATVVVVTLVACGGGGSDTPKPASTIAPVASDKYVGTWMHCEPASGAENRIVSVRSTYVYSKQSATTLSFSRNAAAFSVANCGGSNFNNVVGQEIATGTLTLNGTKVIGDQTVDRLSVTTVSTTAGLNGTYNSVGLVSTTTMIFGIGLFDAEGYPTQLETAYVFTKQ